MMVNTVHARCNEKETNGVRKETDVCHKQTVASSTPIREHGYNAWHTVHKSTKPHITFRESSDETIIKVIMIRDSLGRKGGAVGIDVPQLAV